LTQSSATNIADAWKLVLGCDVSSPEFPRRHAEVIGLFTDLLTRVDALPSGVTIKDRVAKYAPAWYGALVHRGSAWNTNQNPPSSTLSDPLLDHLQAVGEQLADRRDESVMDRPGIEAILCNLAEWEELLAEGGLPEDVVCQIRGHVTQIRWLVENVDRFGVSRVIAESNQLAGVGVSAMARSTKLSVRQRIGVALAGLLFFVNQANGFVDDVNGVLEGVAAMPDRVHELVLEYQEPLKLEPRASRELEQGPQSTSEDVFDAETVEDED
jgi:hypothetical protein